MGGEGCLVSAKSFPQKVVPLKVAAALISVQRRVQLEHSSHLVKVCVEVRC